MSHVEVEQPLVLPHGQRDEAREHEEGSQEEDHPCSVEHPRQIVGNVLEENAENHGGDSHDNGVHRCHHGVPHELAHVPRAEQAQLPEEWRPLGQGPSRPLRPAVCGGVVVVSEQLSGGRGRWNGRAQLRAARRSRLCRGASEGAELQLRRAAHKVQKSFRRVWRQLAQSEALVGKPAIEVLATSAVREAAPRDHEEHVAAPAEEAEGRLMHREAHRGSSGSQARECRHDGGCRRRIQARERFVEQEHARRAREQLDGNRHAPPLAAAEAADEGVADALVHDVGEAQVPQNVGNGRLARHRVGPHLRKAECRVESEVLRDGGRAVEHVLLRNVAHQAFALGGGSADAVDLHVTGDVASRLAAGENIQQRGLASAGGSEHGRHAPRNVAARYLDEDRWRERAGHRRDGGRRCC